MDISNSQNTFKAKNLTFKCRGYSYMGEPTEVLIQKSADDEVFPQSFAFS
jgi:hypothetical protein